MALCATAIAAAMAPAAASAGRTVPQGFAGLHMESPKLLEASGVDFTTEMARAAASGVETIRFPVYWSDIQPYSSIGAVPPSRADQFTPDPDGGAPYDWTWLDRFVQAAAAKRIYLVPTLIGAPSWAADKAYPTGKGDNPLIMPVPASFERFGQFAAALAGRYGTGGVFWNEHPTLRPLPILTWQIWNEPNFSYYWPQHVGETQAVTVTVAGSPVVKSLPDLYFAPTYVDLVRKSRAAIKAVDSKAKIMLASMANSDRRTRIPPPGAWVDLTYVYRAGGKGSFDIVAANLFTGLPKNLPTYLGWYRSAMAAGGDSKLPITVTEFSWSASLNHIPLVDSDGNANKMASIIVSPDTQAKNIGLAFSYFVSAIKKSVISGIYWHTWATRYSDTADVWDWSGLVSQSGSTITPTPSLAAYKSAAFKIEGACKRKVLATDCLKK